MTAHPPPAPAEAFGSIYLSGLIPHNRGIHQTNSRILGRYALVLVLAGRGTYSDRNGEIHAISSGSLIHVFPDLAHSYQPHDGGTWKEFFIVFDGPVFVLLEQSGILSRSVPVRQLTSLSYWTQRIQAVPLSGATFSSEEPLREVIRLQEFLIDIHTVTHHKTPPIKRESDQWLAQSQQALIAAASKPHPPREAASMMRLSYQSFRKKFSQLAHQTPRRFINRIRLERSASLLEHTDDTMQQIADKLGYCDPFYFSKQFHKHFGLPPSEYRRNFLKNAHAQMQRKPDCEEH